MIPKDMPEDARPTKNISHKGKKNYRVLGQGGVVIQVELVKQNFYVLEYAPGGDKDETVGSNVSWPFWGGLDKAWAETVRRSGFVPI